METRGEMSVLFEDHDRICYKWVIDNDWEKFCGPMRSNLFTMTAHCTCPFGLELLESEKSNGNSDNEEDIDIGVVQMSGRAIRAAVRVIVNNGNSSTLDATYWKDSEIIVFKLPRPSFNTQTLSIICHIRWYGYHDSFGPRLYHPGLNLIPYLCHGDNDFIVEVLGSKLPVHKPILAASSPVLYKMFTTSEGPKIHHVIVENVEVSTMINVLQWMYSGDISTIYDISEIFKILTVAKKFQMAELKSFCLSTIFERLSVTNVMLIAEYLRRHYLPELSTIVLSFMLENHARVMELDKFRELALEKPPACIREFEIAMDSDRSALYELDGHWYVEND